MNSPDSTSLSIILLPLRSKICKLAGEGLVTLSTTEPWKGLPPGRETDNCVSIEGLVGSIPTGSGVHAQSSVSDHARDASSTASSDKVV